MRTYWLKVCAAIVAALLAPLIARAQEQDQAPVPPEPSAEASTAPEAQRPVPEVPETTVVGEPSGVGSQGSAAPGDTPVITPTRTESTLNRTGSSVSVITSEQIEQRQITSVAEALRGLPGVDVVQQGPRGTVTSVFLRGASSEQTKVLLDGIPLNDPISPGRGFDFSALTLDNIEQIEIIRGPQSTLYGSDAIGGVINIITKKGKGPLSLRYRPMGGSFATHQEAGLVSGGNDDVYYSVGGSYLTTAGISAADSRLPGNSEKDGFRIGTLSTRAGWTPADNFDVDFVLRYNRATTEIDDGGGPFQDDPNERNFGEQAFTRTQLRYLTPNEFWEQKLSYSTADVQRRNIDPTDFLHLDDSFFSNFNGHTQLIDWQHNFFLHETNTLTVGSIYQQENGDSAFTGTSIFGPFSGEFTNKALRDTGVYAQDQIQIADRWFTTLGIRQDHYSQAGTADTYRATTLYRLPGWETGFRGSIGTGFKAPTLFQLFDAFSGNLNLQPEESKGWDVGAEQPLFENFLVVSATYFNNQFNNLIDFNQATFQFFNVNRASSNGAEVNGVFILDELTNMTLSYTRTNTRDLATDLPLLRRPRDKASLTINRKMLDERANLNLILNYVGNREDRDFQQFPAPRVGLPHYVVVNLAGTYDLTCRCQLFARIDNLFNEHYQDVFGFGTAGIAGYGGLTVTW